MDALLKSITPLKDIQFARGVAVGVGNVWIMLQAIRSPGRDPTKPLLIKQTTLREARWAKGAAILALKSGGATERAGLLPSYAPAPRGRGTTTRGLSAEKWRRPSVCGRPHGEQVLAAVHRVEPFARIILALDCITVPDKGVKHDGSV